MPESLRVVFVSSEVFPFSKTGGLADVCGTLPRALAALGVKVRIFTPYYRVVREAKFEVAPAGPPVPVPFGGEPRPARWLETVLPGTSVRVFLLDDPEFFDRDGLYGTPHGDHPDNARRFSFFCRATLEFLRARPEPPGVLHAHDWQAALTIALLRTTLRDRFPRTRTVFTIHNLGYQGLFDAREWGYLGLDWEHFHWRALEYYGRINFLKAGAVFAERITTVSPTYAREIQTEEMGAGLHGLFQHRAADIVGILNGIDTQTWNPRNDPYLEAPFDVENLSGKARCKESLQRKLGLSPDPHVPVLGLVTRLAEQKGVDLFLDVAEQIVGEGAQLAVLGAGSAPLEERTRRLAAGLPGRVAVKIGFDERLAHEIEAGADMFLMPSRYEPCGLNQMISMRYGTIPIVRATGGLADTVVDASEAERGTGFVFTEPSAPAFLACVRRALAAWKHPRGWRDLQRRAMQQDFSWDRSAREYLALYQGLAPAGAGRGAS